MPGLPGRASAMLSREALPNLQFVPATAEMKTERSGKRRSVIRTPALALRQTCDTCQCDIRAFWAAKSTFRAERHQERENARLAGGEDWIRTRGCVSLDVRGLLADKVHISAVCGNRRVPNRRIGQTARFRIVSANQRLVLFLSAYASPLWMDYSVGTDKRTDWMGRGF